ncbi:hypothetical protein CTI12_AA207460 [Artemisia annua]|uniref:Uncharacterized protein n=1 Tax=Artemisia annua TaxID=35608 RepID=A0A2U1P0D7_ARTAN|nr:hypothetical protein CTI12_AA207460 [Artemisia annua]
MKFDQQACSQVGAAGSDPSLNKVADFKDAFWRFLRPHTIRGTALGSVSLVTRALLENPDLIRWSLVFKAFSGLIALICGNGYIVGINQIYDIGIDKVNKPYLPIAAGDLSVQSAWFLVLAFAVVGVIIVAMNFGQFITSLYCLGLFLGTIYSVPPLRMKRFPVVAFLIIATVRGFLLNFGVYYAVRAALGLTFQWRVNKPYLPIAAGDLSVQSAWFLVLAFAVVGVIIVAMNFGQFITSLYCLGLFLGTIYSVPPLRMKRFPVVAFLIIATVRGFLLNFGVYYAVRAALGLTFQWSSAVAFITTFVTLFALVIAITKDLPDVEGDRKFEISTFATKLGVRNIGLLGSGLLLINYIGSIAAALYMPQAFRGNFMVPVHTVLALCLIYQAWVLERAKYTQEAIAGYYRFVWNLFYAEYIIFPFI